LGAKASPASPLSWSDGTSMNDKILPSLEKRDYPQFGL
jgi:hypothetical protein